MKAPCKVAVVSQLATGLFDPVDDATPRVPEAMECEERVDGSAKIDDILPTLVFEGPFEFAKHGVDFVSDLLRSRDHA